MNIVQIKSDMDNGVSVCRATLQKLVNLALRQQNALMEFIETSATSETCVADGYEWTCIHCGKRPSKHAANCLKVRASLLIAEGSNWKPLPQEEA